jgi:uncharacterized protein YjbI with pentapeptide repeats
MDLSGYDLRGIHNPNGRMNGTKFVGSDIRDADFRESYADGIDLSGAQTRGMRLSYGTTLRNVVTEGEFDMTEVIVSNTKISFARPTRLKGINKIIPQQNNDKWGSGLHLGKVIVEDETLSAKDLKGISRFSDSQFVNVRLENPHGAPFELNGMRFDRCDFDDLVASNMSVRNVLFSGCYFANCGLDEWEFSNENSFNGSTFDNVSMRGWKRKEPFLSSARVRFSEVSGMHVDLLGAEPFLVRSFVDGAGQYRCFDVSEAAAVSGTSEDDLVLKVWLGEIEMRDNETFDFRTAGNISGCHIPYWALSRH